MWQDRDELMVQMRSIFGADHWPPGWVDSRFSSSGTPCPSSAVGVTFGSLTSPLGEGKAFSELLVQALSQVLPVWVSECPSVAVLAWKPNECKVGSKKPQILPVGLSA